ncbi:SRPBCC domain-containing protein [Winogradskya consettensis]|uniref:Transcriptional regulator n=2 Tax=Winogradskya TaxID=3240235 RepID=A0A919SK16_9ACTN|nr:MULTISPECIES: SRPBCC domain-containing protein [Actinoplanes]GIE25428.1 transcriptional regulator [Actinoplanes humidus]GIM72108.1 transcriptional regulator [Actinoplanes consettensis]
MTEPLTTQVFRVWIRTTPEKIWTAITDPEWNQKYGYAAPQFYDLKPGGEFKSIPSDEMRSYSKEQGWPLPDTIIDGEVIEADPPRLLKQTWRMLMDPTTAAEPFTTITYLIEELKSQPGVCRLTLTHELTGAPATSTMVAGSPLDEAGGGGWAWVLSDLKSLLETGTTMAGNS